MSAAVGWPAFVMISLGINLKSMCDAEKWETFKHPENKKLVFPTSGNYCKIIICKLCQIMQLLNLAIKKEVYIWRNFVSKQGFYVQTYIHGYFPLYI